jgi:predicted ATPase
MKLDRFHIRSQFKNLRDFSIDFDETSDMTVLVGRNGTGKSNVLEALTIVFRDLDLKERPQFSYTIDYVCRGHRIHVDANPERKSHNGYEVKVDDGDLTFNAFRDAPNREYLPSFVFGYYSGPSNRMEQHFDRHQRQFYEALLGTDDEMAVPFRPLFFARPVHSQFVLLAFFIDQDPAIRKFLEEHLWITGFEYALFVMRQPPWKSKQGDPRFWKARGVVSKFLARLFEQAIAPLRLSRRVPVDFKSQQTLEHLYLFLPDLEGVRAVAAEYATQQSLFKALESTYISKLISEVRISVQAKKVDGSLTFRELSEGEQQLLMVLGLLRFTREEESLFLLDEPDTHLNPAWSVDYLQLIRDIGGASETSHVIMATHDPLVISGLGRKQVQLFQRDDEMGRVTASPPEDDPRLMGVAALLKSDVYGLRSLLPPATTHLLEEKRRLAAKATLTNEEREHLREIDEFLGAVDFTEEVRDPAYHLFVTAMAVRQEEKGLDKSVLSPDERGELSRLALEVVEEVAASEGET